MGGPGIQYLVTTHAELPCLLGSAQDGTGSQHEAGSIRKAVEGGLGQGETHPCVPKPAQSFCHSPCWSVLPSAIKGMRQVTHRPTRHQEKKDTDLGHAGRV